MTVLFQHLRNTKNIGDRWCSPFDWLTFPYASQVKDIRELSDPYKVSIIGGGKIFGGLANYAGVQEPKNRLNIAWGVSTVQKFPISLRYSRSRKLMSLVGTRDWGDNRFSWVPCASCMAPEFDEAIEPEHEVVFYYHAGKTEKQKIKIPQHIPKLSNNAATLTEALRFIASGKTVISNSYHGVYWAMLMGRRTICIPFSNKFNYYRLPPTYANNRNWKAKLRDANAHPNFLSLCREATRSYEISVNNFISQFLTTH